MKIGDKIKTFEVVDIIEKESFKYSSNGGKKKYVGKFMLLLSVSKQERVLEVGKTSLNESETVYGWSKFRFAKWNDFVAIR